MILPLGKIVLIWESPSENLYSTLIEYKIELGLFHLENILVIEGHLGDVAESCGRDLGGLYFI